MSNEEAGPATDESSASLRELAFQATAAWGLRAKSISLIKQRENAVYKLQTEDDELFALRVHRAGYHTDASLNSEFVWMQALQEAGINVPTFLLSLSNDVVVTTSHASLDAPRQVDILHWIDGQQLGSVEEGLGDNGEEISKIYSVIGKAMAQLHIHSSTWSTPAGFTRHSWDAAGLVGEEPFWGRFWELTSLSPENRKLILRARAAAAEKLAQLPKTPAHFGMIHADLVPENILIADGEIRLIDFDDAGFGWYLFDIATALYFIQDEPNYGLAKAALLSAYQEIRELPQEELDNLPLFLLVRSFTYLGWVHTRPGSKEAQELAPMLIEMCLAAVARYDEEAK